MSASHTSGPWRLEEWTACDTDGALENSGYRVVDAEGNAVHACTEEGSGEAQEANVYLIAAAPDLLAALRAVVHDDADGGEEGLSIPVFQQAIAAISKATGAAK